MIIYKKTKDPIPKNERKPITSVTVVTKTLEASAGSIFIFFRVTGIFFFRGGRASVSLKGLFSPMFSFFGWHIYILYFLFFLDSFHFKFRVV